MKTDKRNFPRPAVLCVMDGWGHREGGADNAVASSNAPNFRRIMAESPHALLDASEEHVGLPAGQMGNSEVGHMNLGAGRVVFQDLPMIDRALAMGELEKNPALTDFISKLKQSGGTCHLMGLLSDGGVHSHQRHIAALARIISRSGVAVAVHAFTDGRDTPPASASRYLSFLSDELKSSPQAKLATVCGRYFAMDRDKRWDRVEKAYVLLTDGVGLAFDDALSAVDVRRAAGETDEFLSPIAIGGYGGMKDGDGVLFANFRADRAREILLALLDDDFPGFLRGRRVGFAAALGMVEYSDRLNGLMATMFPPKTIANGLGELVSAAGMRQLRLAETEKYPHVTFFFNGGREEPYAGEERIMVQSPKVATYDLQPEMSAREVTNYAVKAVESGMFDLIVMNYANPDMVGHTGSLEAAIKAVETVDECLGRLAEAVKERGGFIVLTADHGNCETMKDPLSGAPHTAHTLERVPVALINPPAGIKSLRDGKLADVAPTMLEIMGLDKPEEMDGNSLIVPANA